MEAEGVFRKAVTGVAFDGHDLSRSVVVLDIRCRFSDEKRELVSYPFPSMAAEDIDVRAGPTVDVRQLEVEFDGAPIIHVEVEAVL